MAKHLTRGQRNIQWIESQLRIPHGPLYGQPFKLCPFQQDGLIRIYDNPVLTRMAILSFARKNGKTALASALMLLHFIGPESRQNAQMYSAAQTREQAGIVFNHARKMVELNPSFSKIVRVIRSRKELICDSRGTEYRALASEAGGAYGLDPLCVIHDELGQVRGGYDEFFEALETSMGAQDNPLSLVISTQASGDDDLLSTLIDDAQSGRDPSRIAIVYTADKLKKPYSMKGLRAANPGLDDFMNVKELKSAMKLANRLPSKRTSFMNLNLNMRVEMNDPFMTKEAWGKCIGQLPALESFEYRYAGLDLSSTKDLTAFVVVGVKAGLYYVYPTMWIPRQGLRERSDSEKVRYFEWWQLKKLEATPGVIIKRQYAADYIFDLNERAPIEKIAYDAWDYKNFINNLEQAGFPSWQVNPEEGDKDEMLFELFRQNFQSMSPAIRTTEELILEQRLVHDNNPVLNFNISNCQVVEDNAGNRKLVKAASKKTIDGAIAMIMALALAYREHGDYKNEDDEIEAIARMLG